MAHCRQPQVRIAALNRYLSNWSQPVHKFYPLVMRAVRVSEDPQLQSRVFWRPEKSI